MHHGRQRFLLRASRIIRISVVTATLSGALLCVSCKKDDAPPPPPPPPSPTVVAVAQPALIIPSGALLFSGKDGSTVGFTGKKITASHDGTFGVFHGYITMNQNMLESVGVNIDLKSTSTDSKKLTKHLLSPDFFDSNNHRDARFVSTSVEEGGDGGEPTHIVKGTLSLRGVTKDVTVPTFVTLTPEKVSARGEFTINRQDFGVRYPGRADDLISDDVVIRFDVSSPRAPVGGAAVDNAAVDGAATGEGKGAAPK